MKKRILLNWEAYRVDLLEPFIKLQNDFHFILIWYNEPVQYKVAHPFEEIYFGDYKSPYDLLNSVEPSKIIFFGISNFSQIALNLAAKNTGICTYTLHHGVYSSNLAQITALRREMNIEKKRKSGLNHKLLSFYIRALKWKNLNIISDYLIYPLRLYRHGALKAMYQTKFAARMPVKFIQLSPHNAKVSKEMNGLSDDALFEYIGHPGFDKFLQESNAIYSRSKPEDLVGKYWLLIDFPNTEVNIGFKKIGWERKSAFYDKLADMAAEYGCRLIVKLHPAGYESPYAITHDNITVIKDVDILRFILYADKCFSFYSTLLIPIIFLKKHCVVFDLGLDIALQSELVQLNVATLVQVETFTEEDIQFSGNGYSNEDNYAEFLSRYLYLTDGRATERLKGILDRETC